MKGQTVARYASLNDYPDNPIYEGQLGYEEAYFEEVLFKGSPLTIVGNKEADMGWAFCGTNPVTGEEMGYGVAGICHHPGCGAEIDHGLSYVCGSMHGGASRGCGYYFCTKHLTFVEFEHTERTIQLCEKCLKKNERKRE